MFSHIKELFTRPSGYTIARSVRLRSSASAYLNRTPSVAGNQKTWTWSAWVKRGKLGATQGLFARNDASVATYLIFTSSDTLEMTSASGAVDLDLVTTQVFRDPSAWYHLVLAVDTTQATASNRIKMYVNGIQITSFSTATYPAQNYNTYVNTAATHYIGNGNPAGSLGWYSDQYLTEINFVNAQQLTPSSFGETDSITGVWKPKKYAGTYGTNGFYLNFSDNSSNTSTTIGKDYSGNGNNWTPNNISVTAGVTYDSMVDSPTVSALSSNYCVLNPLEKYSGLTVADGNLKVTSSDNTQYGAAGTLAVSSGKWYYEAMFSNASVNNMAMGLTTTQNNVQTAQWAGSTGMFMCGNFVTGTAIHVGVNGSYTQVSTTLPSAGSYLVCALDYDNGKAWFGTTTSSGGAVTWYPASTGGSVGDPAAGTNPTITFSTTYPIRPFMGSYSAGLNWIANFGQRPFITTAPSGFNAWNTYNLPASTIKNGAAYMAATLYTGNGSTQSITNTVNGVNFQPDMVWAKNRSNVENHQIFDSVRGVNNALYPNLTNAAGTDPGVTAFNSNGFSLGGTNNTNAQTYVAWQWKAGGTSSSNTNGSITSTVSVGATQGFSVVTYTGTGANATVGHGLGVAPSMVIVKSRTNGTTSWAVYHSNLTSASYYLFLDSTSAQSSNATVWNSTAPTSTVFSIGTATPVNQSSNTFVAYCFSAVAGYSAFGSYTGNGSTDGPFVFTGFRPRWIMVKNYSSAGNGWAIRDTSRDPYNVANATLTANSSSAEATALYNIDILSNGFKIRDTGTDSNGNGTTYIYACFAENPFRNALAR